MREKVGDGKSAHGLKHHVFNGGYMAKHEHEERFLYDNGCILCDMQANIVAYAQNKPMHYPPWCDTPETQEGCIIEDISYLMRAHGIPTSNDIERLSAECY